MAIAHGAGLMLVPIYLGLCRAADLDKGHEAAGALINANLGMAVVVSAVHSVAMIAAGGFLAWLVYRYLGLKFVSQSWFNLDATWAFSLSPGGRSIARGQLSKPAIDPHLGLLSRASILFRLPERLHQANDQNTPLARPVRRHRP